MSSGKFLLRTDPSLHRVLKKAAEARGLSLNEYCARVLQAGQQRNDGFEGPLLSALENEFETSLVGVVLFGSAARGELTTSSDIDLLIVVDGEISRSLYRRWDESRDLQEAL